MKKGILIVCLLLVACQSEPDLVITDTDYSLTITNQGSQMEEVSIEFTSTYLKGDESGWSEISSTKSQMEEIDVSSEVTIPFSDCLPERSDEQGNHYVCEVVIYQGDEIVDIMEVVLKYREPDTDSPYIAECSTKTAYEQEKQNKVNLIDPENPPRWTDIIADKYPGMGEKEKFALFQAQSSCELKLAKDYQEVYKIMEDYPKKMAEFGWEPEDIERLKYKYDDEEFIMMWLREEKRICPEVAELVE